MNISLASVDTLGVLLAQIKDLTDQADQIKNTIKDAATLPGGAKTYEGSLFKATFSETNRESVDYKKLCADLKITEEQLSKYTKTTAVFAVKTTARK